MFWRFGSHKKTHIKFVNSNKPVEFLPNLPIGLILEFVALATRSITVLPLESFTIEYYTITIYYIITMEYYRIINSDIFERIKV